MSPRSTLTIKPQSKRALANQEKEVQIARLRSLGRRATLLAATILSFSVVGLLVVDQMYRPDSFVIDRLKIKGNFQYLDPQKIEGQINAIDVGNFFSLRLAAIKSQVEAIPLVQSVEVRREWPHTLLLEVKEQRPVMRWGDDKWVNTDGDVVELPEEVSASSTIKLKGNERDSKELMLNSLAWAELLKNKNMSLVSVALTDSRSYTLKIIDPRFENEFDLLLGRVEVPQRLRRFIALFQHEYGATNQMIERVDARYPDGLAVRLTEIESIESVAFTNSQGDVNKGSQIGINYE